MSIDLDPSQELAVDLVCSARFGLVTGGPGTGKTTCLSTALDRLDALGVVYRLAAPTGKAARRMGEATGRHASTVHRLLELGPLEGGGMGFRKNEENPIEADLVVVDEASMLDVHLADALMRAISPQRTRLVLVGDANQLPSVGPGRVFGDLIEAGSLPCARLTKLHRAAAASWVCTQAPAILSGVEPELGERTDFVWRDNENRDRAVEALISAVFRELPARGVTPAEIQVLIPQRIGPAGCTAVNPRLQALLNPSRDSDPEGWKVGGAEDAAVLRVRDRVIQTKNDYTLSIMNGEVGEVVSILNEPSECKPCNGGGVTNLERFEGVKCVPCNGTGKRGPLLTVRYPADEGGTRHVEYSKGEAYALDLAYALTIHKSQGSQWPWVVVFCHSTHTRMLTRQLLYTGITRAQRGVVLVGDRVGLGRAVKETRDARRNTGLVDRLRAGSTDPEIEALAAAARADIAATPPDPDLSPEFADL